MSNVKKWEEISSDVAIRTDVYQPKIKDGKTTGYLEYVKQRTFQDVREQFESALKAIHVDSWGHSAFCAVEYISYFDYDQVGSEDLPKGCLRVIVCDGNCEGTRIELVLLNTDNNYIPILSAKYLSDSNEVWNIGRQIYQACTNGQFGC